MVFLFYFKLSFEDHFSPSRNTTLLVFSWRLDGRAISFSLPNNLYLSFSNIKLAVIFYQYTADIRSSLDLYFCFGDICCWSNGHTFVGHLPFLDASETLPLCMVLSLHYGAVISYCEVSPSFLYSFCMLFVVPVYVLENSQIIVF